MRFWDSSAVVPLLVSEGSTPALEALLASDPVMLVWWSTEVECASALSRLERDGDLDVGPAGEAFDRLRQFADRWHEVEAVADVRETAVRLLRVHPLRGADALQLAAAFIASERRPASLELITLDDRLAAAARKEGFVVTPVTA